ncbi:cytochrome c-type biogenesis protein ResA [Sulfuriferula multivorans]|uniref:Cytochrome c-type biogenesis protein ResA n=1 Tax=Sulfuriferula multivorans TaxID=1559896 RepID=A0A401JCQ7_9PROT|nr:TlpA disulfide reductase family protein [Sulfuriferula multivorans]GBL45364.1 cytochrome c-type biogenesis protein ResA [Sulfuriferula multivorans]
MSNKRYHKYVLITVVLGALAAALYLGLTQKTPAPQVTFTDLTGKKISMQSLHGKMVLVNFWATTCPGCVEEMPHIVETYNQYHDKGFEVIAVAMSYDPPSYVLRFKQQRGLPFPVALDVQGNLAHQFEDVKLTPTSYLIDKDGNIVEQTIGSLDFVKLRSRLDKALIKKG